MLLQEGIGDTIRVSLTPLPNGDRTEEVIVSQQILQSLGSAVFTPQVAACPGCGRTTSTFFQEMADQIQSYLREADAGLARAASRRGGDEGRGDGLRRERSRRIEARQYRHLACREHSKSPLRPVYVDGKLVTTLRGDGIVDTFIGMMNDYVARTYATDGEGALGIAIADEIRAGSLRAIARAATADREPRSSTPSSILQTLFPTQGMRPPSGSPGRPARARARSSISMTRASAGRRTARRAFIAVDPTSPFTGGAILGDRIRMQAHHADPDVFIRRWRPEDSSADWRRRRLICRFFSMPRVTTRS